MLDIPGVGPLIATAAVATMGEASAFKSGREFAAYVGLGSKNKLAPEGKYVCWG
ncbi:transposase, IS1111 family [Shigella sonnei 53G]|nr:transposase, IS1111 family [Shigella sonnei 53G]